MSGIYDEIEELLEKAIDERDHFKMYTRDKDYRDGKIFAYKKCLELMASLKDDGK